MALTSNKQYISTLVDGNLLHFHIGHKVKHQQVYSRTSTDARAFSSTSPAPSTILLEIPNTIRRHDLQLGSDFRADILRKFAARTRNRDFVDWPSSFKDLLSSHHPAHLLFRPKFAAKVAYFISIFILEKLVIFENYNGSALITDTPQPINAFTQKVPSYE